MNRRKRRREEVGDNANSRTTRRRKKRTLRPNLHELQIVSSSSSSDEEEEEEEEEEIIIKDPLSRRRKLGKKYMERNDGIRLRFVSREMKKEYLSSVVEVRDFPANQRIRNLNLNVPEVPKNQNYEMIICNLSGVKKRFVRVRVDGEFVTTMFNSPFFFVDCMSHCVIDKTTRYVNGESKIRKLKIANCGKVKIEVFDVVESSSMKNRMKKVRRKLKKELEDEDVDTSFLETPEERSIFQKKLLDERVSASVYKKSKRKRKKKMGSLNSSFSDERIVDHEDRGKIEDAKFWKISKIPTFTYLCQITNKTNVIKKESQLIGETPETLAPRFQMFPANFHFPKEEEEKMITKKGKKKMKEKKRKKETYEYDGCSEEYVEDGFVVKSQEEEDLYSGQDSDYVNQESSNLQKIQDSNDDLEFREFTVKNNEEEDDIVIIRSGVKKEKRKDDIRIIPSLNKSIPKKFPGINGFRNHIVQRGNIRRRDRKQRGNIRRKKSRVDSKKLSQVKSMTQEEEDDLLNDVVF